MGAEHGYLHCGQSSAGHFVKMVHNGIEASYTKGLIILAETATEILVELKPPPQRLFADAAPEGRRANYLRFRLAPKTAIALAARVNLADKEFVGDQRELYLSEERPEERPEEESPYERLCAMP